MNIIWGPESNQIYNDGYRVVCGDVHPRALGQDYRITWASAWPAIGESFDRAWAGERMFLENQRMFLKRLNGSDLEETFFTFSHSPIQEESGQVGGLFHPVTETTANMLAERRTRALRDLAGSLSVATNEADVARRAVEVLAQFDFDLPFLLYYALDPKSGRYGLAAHHGLSPDTSSSPLSIAPNESGPWPFAEALASSSIIELDDLPTVLQGVACGPYEEPPKRGFVIPIVVPAAEQPPAVIVTGASSRLPLNADYRSFYDLLGVTIAGALSTVRAREDERRRAEALAEIDRAKTAFFSNVSHEFRTPLTLMLGPLEDTLAHSKALPLAEREQLETVQRNSLRLLKLVNTLLDFSRIEAGRVQAIYEPTDLASATAELASVFRSAIEKAGLNFIVDCPSLSEPIYVDRDMWEKIVLNLISNAFKFTFAGEIEVRLRESSGRIELVVRDTGAGIPSDELPKLFERFHRVAGVHGRTHEGSGIGLALVQELTRLHGGSVSVDSVPGQGSAFKITIPRGRGHLPAEQIGAARTQASTAPGALPFVEEALRWLPSVGSEEERVIADVDVGTLANEGAEGRARIVLADDNADMRDYVRRLLASRYDVEVVGDGQAALAAIARDRPDLVLSDIMMPRLDGMQLLMTLRADPQTNTLPVILLSARAGEESRVEGMQSGADDYLIKPFSARELLARVEAHLKLKRWREQSERALHESAARLAEEAGALAKLNDASTRLWRARDLREGLEEMLAGSIELLGADMGNIQILNESRRMLILEAQHGFKPDFLDFFREVSVEDDSACGRALRSGSRVVIVDVETDVDYAPLREVARAAGYRAVQSTPLIARDGSMIGIISTHWISVHRPSEQALRRLDLYVRLATDFIGRLNAENALRCSAQTLRASEERFRAFVTASSDVVYRMSPDWREMRHLRGKDFIPDTLDPSYSWLAKYIHADDQPHVMSAIDKAIAGKSIFELEHRIIRVDGTLGWTHSRAIPLLGPEGEIVEWFGAARDITARKQSEEAQQLLIAELNHRVKNTLASVQAIARQTLRRTRDPGEFVESFAGRIQSLTRVHSLLSVSSWRSADLSELVRDQILHGTIDDTRVTAVGPPLKMEPQMALHVAMMLHELGTNAVKYGALSSARGWVTVRWAVENRTLRLRWEERGGPAAHVPATSGFGTRLIEQSAKGEGGSARMLVEAEGLSWEIILPLRQLPGSSGNQSVSHHVRGEPARQELQLVQKSSSKLAGRRFLVIEDEPLVALDIADGLTREGAEVVACVASAGEALQMIENQQLDAALLDGNLGGEPIDGIAAALTRRNVPFVFVSGYGRDSLPRAFRDVALINKPFSQAQLLEAAARLLTRETDFERLRKT
jgi:signal transduction histidine kinase/DNA-binding response OmpR family regulator